MAGRKLLEILKIRDEYGGKRKVREAGSSADTCHCCLTGHRLREAEDSAFQPIASSDAALIITAERISYLNRKSSMWNRD